MSPFASDQSIFITIDSQIWGFYLEILLTNHFILQSFDPHQFFSFHFGWCDIFPTSFMPFFLQLFVNLITLAVVLSRWFQVLCLFASIISLKFALVSSTLTSHTVSLPPALPQQMVEAQWAV